MPYSIRSKDIGILGGIAAAALTGIYVLWGPGSSSTSRKKTGRCPGLVNQGNTCFLNAVLQSLASCPSFVCWLADFIDIYSNGDHRQYMAYPLIKVTKVLCNQSEDTEDPYNPVEVLEGLRARRWVISWEEQDAHELFHVLTTTLSEEAEKFPAHPSLLDMATLEARYGIQEKAKNRSEIPLLKLPNSKTDHPFTGSLASQLTCKQCGYRCPIKYDNFDSISLSLSPKYYGNVTLESLLNRFVMSEIVEDVECTGCAKLLAKFNLLKVNGKRDQTTENIKPRATFIKQLNLGKLPQCLCIHINRRIWLPNGMPMKRQDVVKFPEMLNMDKFKYLHQANAKDESSQANAAASCKNNEKTTANGDVPAVPYFCNGSFSQLKPHPMMKGLSSLYRNGINQSVSARGTEVAKSFYQRQMSVESNYKLVAAVAHMGDAYSGHFVTYRRVPTSSGDVLSNQWLYTSDSRVRKVSLKEVMASQAYMLFYERATVK
ncbi:ubiquitin carboxyl-terminal hydrolase 30-like isoform X2 [Ptychodera flava]|uniref:ubiquitin carboxyl-terminal hydrolase 30-like isoform X2 n=1 Tax=Ptychodera flava TaxID=63121 RepID=UPI003969E22D